MSPPYALGSTIVPAYNAFSTLTHPNHSTSRCRSAFMHSNSAYWQSFLDHSELSDVGLRRANNQDSMACMLAGNEVDFFRRGHIFVVADGMGRHAAGELA